MSDCRTWLVLRAVEAASLSGTHCDGLSCSESDMAGITVEDVTGDGLDTICKMIGERVGLFLLTSRRLNT